MKRTAVLDPSHPDWGCPQPDAALLHRLTGHLAARLREYTQEGLAPVEVLQDGLVSARIAGVDADQAVSRLAQARVYCQAQDGALHFSIGIGATFEDLDYVQAVVAALLEEA